MNFSLLIQDESAYCGEREALLSKEIKTQWHPAFCSAMKLELKEDKKHLEYYNEYNLNRMPLQIDLLVIKKAAKVELKNEIGKIFKGHNIIEYKSPDDGLKDHADSVRLRRN